MKWTFPNLRLFLSLAVITGGIYPLVVTLVSLIFFPHQAHGSLIRNERGEIIASELVAQPFISAKYFWPRPSAGDYATMPSGASNLSWTSGELVRTVAERKAALLKAHNLPQETPVPADLLFASGSGLESCIQALREIPKAIKTFEIVNSPFASLKTRQSRKNEFEA